MKKLRLGAFALIVGLAVVFADQGTSMLQVRKCCGKNEQFEQIEANSTETPRCKLNQKDFKWNILIYSPNERNYLRDFPDNWKLLESTRPVCKTPGTVLTYVPFRKSNPFILMESGEVILEVANEKSFSPEEFCMDANALLVCMQKKPEEKHAAVVMKAKVRKCCGENAVFHEEKKTCAFGNYPDDIPTFLPNISFMVEILQGFPTCLNSDNFTYLGDSKDAVLQPDGSLRVAGVDLPAYQFCIERIKELNLAAKVFACSEHVPQRPLIKAQGDVRFTLYSVGFIISALFLAATLVAGCLLPASHHVLHWRCQTHHVACLMTGDILMAIIQLASGSLPNGACKAFAIMAHFFFLAAFFWLNTMCFNIWWTFRDLRPASLEKGQETLRLRVYACYAWGGPLLVAGLAALLDHLPAQPQYTFLRPRFAEKQCWFYGDMEILAYFYGPVGVLLAINLLFFAATARELTCGLWKGEFVKSTTERAALGRVCMKLVVVMGITWVADVISWAAGGPQYIWYFTDLINAFQGVLIFFFCGCQPQVRAAIKRICNRNPRTNAGRQGNGLSTTSHGMPSMGDSVTQNPSTKTAPLETIC
ncbi:probable G-protein coupled receptor Mth-like 1 [Prorops nasuta]|uniref:probable G-protein coupled receptor Mth-like 1 n=1 Tax=Prorops nasuta TaxID=863751 RepID=UPI0034CFE035